MSDALIPLAIYPPCAAAHARHINQACTMLLAIAAHAKHHATCMSWLQAAAHYTARPSRAPPCPATRPSPPCHTAPTLRTPRPFRTKRDRDMYKCWDHLSAPARHAGRQAKRGVWAPPGARAAGSVCLALERSRSPAQPPILLPQPAPCLAMTNRPLSVCG